MDAEGHEPEVGSARTLSAVELHWIPLGAGQSVVRTSGKLFEATLALIQRRRACALFHSALVVRTPEGRYTIEMAPSPDANGAQRGVVAEGPVGARWAGRLRVFRYEVRRWREGDIPDLKYATSTVRLDIDGQRSEQLLDLVGAVPTAVWGRDELHAGEMWNSNSVVSWVLTMIGIDTAQLALPQGGRAPGWDAGRVVAERGRS